jgi:aspartyl-tRNA(Asn)/glutamyl-tRNA(Gln) amidotransferase subunit C
MSAIDESTIRRLAELATAGRLERLLEYVARIQAVEVDAVEESSPVESGGAPTRPDEARPGLPIELATAGAPAVRDGLFEVPRVLGGEADEDAE